MITYLKSILFFAAFLPVVSICVAQGKWEQKINENGIQIFTRKPLNGNLKELRVMCELKCSKEQLIKTLQDIKNYHKWVYSTKITEGLKVVNPQQMIYYSVSHLPWPLKDRDLIIQLTILPVTESNFFEIEARSLPAYLPVNANYIRVPYSLALWKVTEVGDHLLKVDYTFSVDPGGSIPAWLVNSTLAIGPYNSFMKLREQF
ncbi:MAG: START domain-containing protein [Mucilaginibacter sp.]